MPATQPRENLFLGFAHNWPGLATPNPDKPAPAVHFKQTEYLFSSFKQAPIPIGIELCAEIGFVLTALRRAHQMVRITEKFSHHLRGMPESRSLALCQEAEKPVPLNVRPS
jgi:hypothetical protein